MTWRAAIPVLTLVLFAVGANAAQLFGRSSPPPPAAVAPPSAPAEPTLAQAHPDAHGVKRMAVLRALDKISGRTTDINAPAGVPVHYGPLIITAQYCYTVPPQEPPETTAFLQIDEAKPGQPQKRLFSGWMFASAPALNGLEHPTYDVWVITCKTEEPVSPDAPAPGTAAADSPASPPAAGAPAPAR
jgi:hypothetical protein